MDDSIFCLFVERPDAPGPIQPSSSIDSKSLLLSTGIAFDVSCDWEARFPGLRRGEGAQHTDGEESGDVDCPDVGDVGCAGACSVVEVGAGCP